ncbi:unnamed protein product [Amoebophrya sp. A120]|nr:unnamed protein product [Amoebophrya sp. A120]|eukprot:GSA120T00024679001.1
MEQQDRMNLNLTSSQAKRRLQNDNPWLDAQLVRALSIRDVSQQQGLVAQGINGNMVVPQSNSGTYFIAAEVEDVGAPAGGVMEYTTSTRRAEEQQHQQPEGEQAPLEEDFLLPKI